MPLILLVRHGENEFVKKKKLPGRLPGIHLNERGRQQAQALAEKLKGAPLKALYASPLERAMETAAPIAEALGVQVIPRPALMDVDVGEWQGESLSKLRRQKLWKVVQGAPTRLRFPGGETFAEAQGRMVTEIEALCKLHDPKEMFACVTHADPIRLVVAYYLGLPLDLFQRLVVNTAAITAISIGEMGSHLLTMNYDLSLTFSKA
jgi:probable phosphoglycerate mutase